jgi:hypothetical protein
MILYDTLIPPLRRKVMFTQEEITEYVEEIHRVEEYTGHWQRQLDRAREHQARVVEWYGEYEEETGTTLGCD